LHTYLLLLLTLHASADGDRVRRGEEFGILKGSARSILVAERIALNFMQVRGQGRFARRSSPFCRAAEAARTPSV
jgi:nicotinate-nucleotide pyrophosphorylase (carboxylating)